MVKYELPLNEVVFDFYDRLKWLHAAMPRSTTTWPLTAPADLVKMEILVNGDPVDALSMLVHRKRAERRGRACARSSRS